MASDQISAQIIPFLRPAARPNQSHRIRGWQLALLIALLSIALPFVGMVHPSHAAEPSEAQTANGMTVYIGLIPAAIIKGHPEIMMHGGKPSGVNEFHLTVAVFDAATGQRISDATVSATVGEVGLAGPTTTLEPMHIADTVTYGGFVVMRTMARYDLRIDVTRPMRSPTTFHFAYDRAHQ
jgi:hypothetical protein